MVKCQTLQRERRLSWRAIDMATQSIESAKRETRRDTHKPPPEAPPGGSVLSAAAWNGFWRFQKSRKGFADVL